MFQSCWLICHQLHFTRAINSLVREALSLGRGDFGKRVQVRSNDELGLLAFNELV